MRRLLLGTFTVIGLVGVAVAQTPAQRIAARQGHYKQMGAAMKGINDTLHSGSPDLALVRRNSAVLLRFAPQVLTWFPRGSGAEAGVRTRARPEIWSDWPGFQRAGAGLLVATRQLDAAARGGDLAAIRAAVPQAAHACSACHDDYRAPEH